MSPDDQYSGEVGRDEADTANFQEFMDSRADAPNSSRTFYLLTLLAGIAVLALIMYLLLL